MGWPKGRSRKPLIPPRVTVVADTVVASRDPNEQTHFTNVTPAPLPDAPECDYDVPQFWSRGALLNVRNRGDHYCITLYPEEFDQRHPERAVSFPNTWTCQDFVSKWYSRETADPRAR